MSQSRLQTILPDFYNFLPDFFQEFVPDETKATCDNCAMCDRSQSSRHPPDGFFSPNSKCCSYQPTLPNYAVGALLNDTRPELSEGRRRIRLKIEQRLGVTPRGIEASERFKFLYKNSPSAFGQHTELICPYFSQEEGGCTVWPYREAVCSTYFCKFVRGLDGSHFWSSLTGYLQMAEEALVRYVLIKTGWPPEVILKKDAAENLDARSLRNEPVDEVTWNKVWGSWVGREEDFYIRCYELVSSLDTEQFQKVAGVNQEVQLAHLQESYQKMMSPVLPDPLIRNLHMDSWKDDGDHYLLTTYRDYDPLRVSNRLFRALDHFDGQSSNEDVIKRIRSEKVGVSLPLVTQLYQFRVLIAKEENGGTASLKTYR